MISELLERERPWQWGVMDCALWLAEWLILNGYDDPAFDLRGAYSDEASCLALLAERGGLLAVVTACAARAGLQEIDKPEHGCVAVIGSANNPARQCCAIWSSDGWRIFQEQGFLTVRARAVRMWRVSCPN